MAFVLFMANLALITALALKRLKRYKQNSHIANQQVIEAAYRSQAQIQQSPSS